MAKKEIKTLTTRNVIADGDKLIVNTTDNQTVQVPFSLFKDQINRKLAKIKVGTINLISSMKPILFTSSAEGRVTSVLRTDEDDHYYRATPLAGMSTSIHLGMNLRPETSFMAGIYVRHNSDAELATIVIRCDTSLAESMKVYSLKKGVWTWISTDAFSVKTYGNLAIYITQVSVSLDYKKVFYSEGNVSLTEWSPSLEEMGLTQ